MTLDDGFVLHISVNDINWYRLMVVNFIDRLQKVKILLIASEAVVSGCVCVYSIKIRCHSNHCVHLKVTPDLEKVKSP